MKSLLGDEVVFEETHEALQLSFRYSWRFARNYGFVRSASLTNLTDQTKSIRLVDGLDNFLPPGSDSRLQLHYSCLAAAYKLTELAGCPIALVSVGPGRDETIYRTDPFAPAG